MQNQSSGNDQISNFLMNIQQYQQNNNQQMIFELSQESSVNSQQNGSSDSINTANNEKQYSNVNNNELEIENSYILNEMKDTELLEQQFQDPIYRNDEKVILNNLDFEQQSLLDIEIIVQKLKLQKDETNYEDFDHVNQIYDLEESVIYSLQQ